jgi:hypothetical protein
MVVAMHVHYGAHDFWPIRWDMFIARLPGIHGDVNFPCTRATPSGRFTTIRQFIPHNVMDVTPIK